MLTPVRSAIRRRPRTSRASPMPETSTIVEPPAALKCSTSAAASAPARRRCPRLRPACRPPARPCSVASLASRPIGPFGRSRSFVRARYINRRVWTMDDTMDEMFDEVLAICLDRLSDGDDAESCVADYPECPDLQPLLELAAALISTSADNFKRADRLAARPDLPLRRLQPPLRPPARRAGRVLRASRRWPAWWCAPF